MLPLDQVEEVPGIMREVAALLERSLGFSIFGAPIRHVNLHLADLLRGGGMGGIRFIPRMCVIPGQLNSIMTEEALMS